MNKRITTDAYFKMPETMRPMELVYGMVREPPAPRYGHQSIVTLLSRLLGSHVAKRKLGEICVSPIDVVLDREAALVVQPDVIFISSGRPRLGCARPGRRSVVSLDSWRDRTTKLGWYRRYGVKECWLVDPRERSVEVVDLRDDTRECFSGTTPIRSHVLRQFDLPAEQCLGSPLGSGAIVKGDLASWKSE